MPELVERREVDAGEENRCKWVRLHTKTPEKQRFQMLKAFSSVGSNHDKTNNNRSHDNNKRTEDNRAAREEVVEEEPPRFRIVETGNLLELRKRHDSSKPSPPTCTELFKSSSSSSIARCRTPFLEKQFDLLEIAQGQCARTERKRQVILDWEKRHTRRWHEEQQTQQRIRQEKQRKAMLERRLQFIQECGAVTKKSRTEWGGLEVLASKSPRRDSQEIHDGSTEETARTSDSWYATLLERLDGVED